MTRALKSRLIVVDDDDILRARIAATIKCSETLDVVGEAATLAEGLQLVARAPDLALVDLGLPDGHGGVLIAYLRRTAPTCRVLVLSVFEDRASVIGAIRAGADGYILKDTPDAEILTSLTHTLEGEAPISARAAMHLLKELRHEAAAEPAAETTPEAPTLTPREKELLEWLARGRSRKEAAREMGISPFTAAEYLQNIYRKLSVNSRAEAVYEALQARLIELDPKKD